MLVTLLHVSHTHSLSKPGTRTRGAERPEVLVFVKSTNIFRRVWYLNIFGRALFGWRLYKTVMLSPDPKKVLLTTTNNIAYTQYDTYIYILDYFLYNHFQTFPGLVWVPTTPWWWRRGTRRPCSVRWVTGSVELQEALSKVHVKILLSKEKREKWKILW